MARTRMRYAAPHLRARGEDWREYADQFATQAAEHYRVLPQGSWIFDEQLVTAAR